jgi:hypothetical protein
MRRVTAGQRTEHSPNHVERLKARGIDHDPVEGLVRICIDGRNPMEFRTRTLEQLSELVLPRQVAVSILQRILDSPGGKDLCA